jgi:hypothetical protein
MDEDNNWRNDPGLKSETRYKRKFALFPTKCYGDETVWLGPYYTEYTYWGFRDIIDTTFDVDKEGIHCDTGENITEGEYLVRKLVHGF